MKLSKNTLNVLKEFVSINKGIHFREGNVLTSVHPSKVIVGQAVIEDTIPQNCVIYDLTTFLGVVSLRKDPEFIFEKNKVIIKDGEVSINYGFADPSTVKGPPDKPITMADVDATITITKEQYEDISKAASALLLEDLKIEGDGETVSLVAFDSKGASSHTYVLKTNSVTPHKFSFLFKFAHLQIVPSSYEVSVKLGVAGHFKSKDLPLQYWVALDKASKFIS